jgi:HlyD family secretion protein
MRMEVGSFKTLSPLKSLVPSMFSDAMGPGDNDPDQRLKKTMTTGAVIVGVFLVGFLIWAAVSPIDSATSAMGMVRVEANRKVIRHLGGGTVKGIFVREGQRVAPGQILLTLSDVQPRMTTDVVQNQYDTYMAQSARFSAEANGRRSVVYPAELTSRSSDPRVAGIMRDQDLLFSTRLQFFESQNDILNQRVEQIQTQIQGVQAQIDALDDSVKLTNEELAGYQTLYEKGYAPKTLILRYQRSLADLAGRRGGLVSDLNRLKQQVGESRYQIAAQKDQRISQAADGLRQMQSGLEEARPRLTAATQLLNDSVVRSPVDGYVLSLSQHTVGGVVAPGDLLMEIVPADSPMVVQVEIRPQDIDHVRIGMKAKVRLLAFNSRKVPPLVGVVRTVSADQLENSKTGRAYFIAELTIAPSELSKLPKGSRLTPGMPAQAMIVTGRKTILSYVISPLTDTIGDALREP